MITLTREEAQQVLVVLTYHYKGRPEDYEVIYNLRTRLAQSEPEQLGKIVPADEEQLKRIAKLVAPEPEPVAWLHSFTGGGWRVVPEKEYPTDRPLYLAPPQREWYGLTDEEKEDVLKGSKNAYDAIERIEAKLKEKNT